jgi:hypothetical protein
MVLRPALLRWLTGVFLLAAPAGCAAPDAPSPAVSPAVQATPTGPWLGSGSCASMGCHNANGLKGEPRSEYTTWVSHDPHARAYEVLYHPRSRAIMERLYPGKQAKAYEDVLCLRCHVHTDYPSTRDEEQRLHSPRFAREDGVGCESCHGPAGRWLSEHYRSRYSSEEKLAMGMWDTWSPAGRVRTCTPCHVGSAGADVNHDLIAAGHPRLAFDFSAYQALLPHHWQDEKDRVPGKSARARADWDTVAWLVGEALTTEAALKLLEARAASSIWPEFAEYNCYACHHQLQGKSWRQDRDLARAGKAGRPPGSLAWNDWYTDPLPYQLHPGKTDADGVPEALATLRKLMEQRSPDGKAAPAAVKKAVAALDRWAATAEKHKYAAADVGGLLKELVGRGADRPADSWDEAAKLYLAVLALNQAAPRSQLKGPLADIADALRFPPDSDGPRPSYTPQRLQELYAALQRQLAKTPDRK